MRAIHDIGVAARATPVGRSPPPLSLYVHVPWCVRKCPYCDFNSHAARGAIPEDAYLAALEADLTAALPSVWGRHVRSVFIGGGTPSLLSGAAVGRLLTTIRTLLALDPGAEITLEANPGTAEVEKFRAFRDAGVNRLSIGVQSFDDPMLAALGRVHDGSEARRAVDMALAVFDKVNLDLMYGLPGQTLDDARRDLETGIASGVTHLSAYHLTLEPNTAFGHTPPPNLPDDDLCADMQDMVEATLAAAGFEHYETSAFARPGGRCVHNLNYWTFGDYLGIGPGAHSKLTFHNRIAREMRHKHPQSYLASASASGGGFIQSTEDVPLHAIPGEFMMNAARLVAGFDLALYPARTGEPTTSLLRPLDEAVRRGLVRCDALRVIPTALGRRFLNDLIALFI